MQAKAKSPEKECGLPTMDAATQVKALREPKQVRMRAGFGVFAPSRVGRLLEEAKATNAVSPSSRPASGSSSAGADAPGNAPAMTHSSRPSSTAPSLAASQGSEDLAPSAKGSKSAGQHVRAATPVQGQAPESAGPGGSRSCLGAAAMSCCYVLMA